MERQRDILSILINFVTLQSATLSSCRYAACAAPFCVRDLGLATGICLCIVGFGYVALYLRNPEYFDRSDKMSGGAYVPAAMGP